MNQLRELPALNDNYTPARPWVCTSHEAHECDGQVVGAIGANPVCANGYTVEVEAREADRLRIEALLATPEMQRQLAWEQKMEARFS